MIVDQDLITPTIKVKKKKIIRGIKKPLAVKLRVLMVDARTVP
jgi:hypothetical protein